MDEQEQDDKPTRRDWLLALYGIAHADTRWAKERGWQAIVWCFSLFGGLLALHRYSFKEAPYWSFGTFVILIALLSAGHLWDLHKLAAGSRDTSSDIRKTMQEDVKKLLALPSDDRNHTVYFVAQLGGIAIGAGVTLLGLCWTP